MTATTTMSGSVVDQWTGTPLAGIRVILTGADGNYYTETTTNTSGAWSASVGDGTYSALFVDPSRTHGNGWYYLRNGQFGTDAPSWSSTDQKWIEATFTTGSQYVTRLVVRGASVQGVNVRLPLAHQLSGIVRDPATGAGIDGLQVDLYSTPENFYEGTVTSGGGRYSMPVPTGSYIVRVWNEQTTWEAGYDGYDKLIYASVQQADATQDITAKRCVHITGQVTDEDGTGLPNIEAAVQQYQIGAPVWLTTGPDGRYSAWVEPGSYYVGFIDDNSLRAGGWATSDGHLSVGLPTSPVVVASSDVSVDVSMPLATSFIRGTVSGASGPAANVMVDLYDSAPIDLAVTADDGTFAIPAMPGAYWLEFSDPSGALSPGWYASPGGFSYAFSSATAQWVVADADVVVTTTLPPASHLQGTVRGVDAGYSYAEIETEPYPSIFATADGNGSYSVSVVPGSYRVCVWPEVPAGSEVGGAYYPACYSRNGSVPLWDGTGDSIAVGPSEDISGIDIDLATVPDAPTNVVATAAADGLHVSWTPSASGHGSPVTGYGVMGPSGLLTTVSGTSVTLTAQPNQRERIQVYAINEFGRSLLAQSDAVWPNAAATSYVSLTPTRILDTRNGTGGLGIFHSRVAQRLSVWGHGGVPASAVAVTGNLTVTGQTSAGFLYVGPNAMNDPTSSNLNFPVGDDRANGVTVALSSDGGLYVTYAAPVRNGPTAHVIFDVTGYFVAGDGGATYTPVLPMRLLDTRFGFGELLALHSHQSKSFVVRGRGGVPSTAIAVTGNLTVTGQTSNGFLYIGPNGMNDPTSSTLNFPKGDDRANAVTVPLSPDGRLFVTFAAPVRDTPTAQALFDVTGYFEPGSNGAYFVPLTPTRILDSRDGTGGLTIFSSRSTRSFPVWGRAGVPTGVVAVTGNLTVTQQTSLGFVYIGPEGENDPRISNLNFPVRDDRANNVATGLSPTGSLWVTYAAPVYTVPKAQVIFDVTGYFVK